MNAPFTADTGSNAHNAVTVTMRTVTAGILETSCAYRQARDCSERRCRDDGRVQSLSSEAMGWYLSDIYGRMKSAGI
jgi:hypothetical protein